MKHSQPLTCSTWSSSAHMPKNQLDWIDLIISNFRRKSLQNQDISYSKILIPFDILNLIESYSINTIYFDWYNNKVITIEEHKTHDMIKLKKGTIYTTLLSTNPIVCNTNVSISFSSKTELFPFSYIFRAGFFVNTNNITDDYRFGRQNITHSYFHETCNLFGRGYFFDSSNHYGMEKGIFKYIGEECTILNDSETVNNRAIDDTISINYNNYNKFEWKLNEKMIDIDIDNDIIKYDKYFAICIVIDACRFNYCKIV